MIAALVPVLLAVSQVSLAATIAREWPLLRRILMERTDSTL